MARADKLTARQVSEIRTRRATGESQDALACAFDVSRQTIAYHTKGIAPPPSGWVRGGRVQQVSGARLIQLHDDHGLTYTALAERFSRPVKGILRTVEKHRRRLRETAAC